MKIRIGKDICLRWTILTNGKETALAGRNLKLYLSDYTRRRVEVPFESSGNTAIITLRASQLQRLGEYVLTLVENEGQEGQTIVDAKPAFTLVEYSTEEDDAAVPDLEVEQVTLATANLTKAGGGISPEDLFAGKPYVMKQGDIVPVMRNGELRPVRVPGTLNGKFRGVIHKAVPIHPRAGMAYVFRDKQLFVHVPNDLRELYENLSILCETFYGTTNKSLITSHTLFYTDGGGIRLQCMSGDFISQPDTDASDILVKIKGYLIPDSSAILILSDGVSIYSPGFRFKFAYSLNDNVEMVSPHYTIQSGRVVFTALPYILRDSDFSRLSSNTVLLRERRTKRSYSYPDGVSTIHRRGFWSRFCTEFRCDDTRKIRRYITYRMMRYETSFHAAKNPNYVEIRGNLLINEKVYYNNREKKRAYQ